MSLQYGDIEMQIDTHHVRCNGSEVSLGPIEFKLLRYMLANPEKVHSREELIEAAWPASVYVGPRTVDVHISRLRKSLNRSSNSDIIRTVRLGGYALESPPL
jgi:two-component system phosphate regulon response regulator PhoB